ncbi:MAG: hypothetical protein Q4615_20235 [Paracoccus aminovorans]|nr:hypothetical protein [Paracoccus aminovorans]
MEKNPQQQIAVSGADDAQMIQVTSFAEEIRERRRSAPCGPPPSAEDAR